MKSFFSNTEFQNDTRIILNNIIEINSKFEYYQGFHTLVALSLNLYQNIDEAY